MAAELTYAKIFLDSIGNTYPVFVETNDATTLVMSLSDSGALGAAASAWRVESYGGYFSWDRPAGQRTFTFAQAVRRAAGAGSIAVDCDLPVARFNALAASGGAEVRGSEPDEPVFIYRKRRADIEKQWLATRDEDAVAVEAFVGSLRRGADLIAAMKVAPVGYAELDRLMSDAGLAALLVSSPFNAEMFTGLPSQVAEQYGMTCLFTPGNEHLIVFAKRAFDRHDFEAAGQAASLAEAVAAIAGGRPVGIEEGHLGIGAYNALSAAGCAAQASVSVLRRWLDQRAGTDLPYFIVAANAVLAGFDSASKYIVRHAQSGVTEREAGAVFAAGASVFAKSVGMDGRIGSYFDIIHSGERTLLPAIAGDYPILPAHQTIKFDMGILVRDAFGCVRACSDIARTLSPSPAIEQCHDDLRALLVERLIPQMRPGMSGGEIHELGVRSLRECEAGLRKAGLMREGATMDGYSRDCGHTIHRTTSGSVYFLPGVKETIEPGMLGCVEYVWPIGDKIIAVEDGYYVTDTEVIPFTI